MTAFNAGLILFSPTKAVLTAGEQDLQFAFFIILFDG